MREYVDIDVLTNWVKMLRAGTDGAIWLADDDDVPFYERCRHHAAVVMGTSGAAVQILERVQASGVEGVVATVHSVQAPEQPREGVFRPSVGDVASLLLLSSACDRVLEDACGGAWLRACRREATSPRTRAFWIARLLERLRQACAREEVRPPNLQDLDGFIRWDTFELDWGRVGTHLRAEGLSNAALEMTRGLGCGTDVRSHISECDGTVAVRILAAATRLYRPMGIAAREEVSPARLIGMLRVAFDLEELGREEMFWRMKGWERQNRRYPLLGEWRVLDPLGVVWDQRYWMPDLACMLRFLRPGRTLAALQIDLDHFKEVNTALGQTGGDEAIRVYCSVLKTVCGAVGEVYRRGGDEAVVLAPEIDQASAEALAEAMRSAVERQLREWATQHKIDTNPTASIGVALATGGESSDEVAHAMDRALRQAKDHGRNRVVILR